MGVDGPLLTLLDEEGSMARIGTAPETHKTYAASVVLFDKDKKVLWQAP